MLFIWQRSYCPIWGWMISNDFNSWIPRGCQYYSEQLTAANITHQINVTLYDHGLFLKKRVEEYPLPFFTNIFEAYLSDTNSRTQGLGYNLLVFLTTAIFVTFTSLRRRNKK